MVDSPTRYPQFGISIDARGPRKAWRPCRAGRTASPEGRDGSPRVDAVSRRPGPAVRALSSVPLNRPLWAARPRMPSGRAPVWVTSSVPGRLPQCPSGLPNPAKGSEGGPELIFWLIAGALLAVNAVNAVVQWLIGDGDPRPEGGLRRLRARPSRRRGRSETQASGRPCLGVRQARPARSRGNVVKPPTLH